jgi:chloramphenicol-sensitive protein RarD
VTGPAPHPENARGALAAAACYLFWGVVPLFWKRLSHLDSYEVIAHRGLWSLFVLLTLCALRGELQAVLAVVREPKQALRNFLTALLLTSNWLLYVIGVNSGRVIECSLGYFLVPLVNVAAGRFVLGERLRPAQGVAIALAALAVLAMVIEFGAVPWFALGLAATWGTYGLLRKRSKLGALAGLASETLLVAPIALAFLAVRFANGDGALSRGTSSDLVWLASTGVVTVIPLLWFGYGAQRIRMTTMGLLQYLSPSVQLALGVYVYGEPFPASRALCFAGIWAGLAIYTIDNLLQQRRTAALAVR